MTLAVAILLALLWVLAWAALVWLTMVWVYRRGFRAAIDFMDGRRPLPPVIISWRGALRNNTEETEQ